MNKKKEIKIAVIGHHPIGSTVLSKELEKRNESVIFLSRDRPAREAEGIMIDGELYRFKKQIVTHRYNVRLIDKHKSEMLSIAHEYEKIKKKKSILPRRQRDRVEKEFHMLFEKIEKK